MIGGIALFPTHYKVSVGGTVDSRIDFLEVPCASSCRVPYADGILHRLVCAGTPGGDFDHVSVEGEIFKKTGSYAPQEHLERMPLGSHIGRDGSCRMYWEWPNKPAFREIDARYEVRLRLLKMPDAVGSPPLAPRDQPPFTVTLLPAPAPVVPQPGKVQ